MAAAATMLLLGATGGLDGGTGRAGRRTAARGGDGGDGGDNGLAFTAVAERAGPFWSGRALGGQNTAQFLTAAPDPPLAGLTATGIGYPATFALAAVFALVALAMVPVRDERELS